MLLRCRAQTTKLGGGRYCSCEGEKRPFWCESECRNRRRKSNCDGRETAVGGMAKAKNDENVVPTRHAVYDVIVMDSGWRTSMAKRHGQWLKDEYGEASWTVAEGRVDWRRCCNRLSLLGHCDEDEAWRGVMDSEWGTSRLASMKSSWAPWPF